jgi:Protein of unknown function (DUF1553)/Protein of unknown function (DUF1549)/Planctomycete cytochrome C
VINKALYRRMNCVMRIAVLLVLLGLLVGADSVDQVAFFEEKIRPVLAEKCYPCHSVGAEEKKKLKGALYLDSKAGTLKGGDAGAAVIPGDVDNSLLLKAILHRDDLEMPPQEKLPDEVIADFVSWVKMGAPDPRVGDSAPKAGQAIAEQTKTHWAFQPLRPPAVPAINNAWIRNDIDRFIIHELTTVGLSPAPPADKAAWLRRATIDLTGLPTTSEHLDAFLSDTSALAYQKNIERLLSSPAYGERWARHWLDVARYADTKGYVFQSERTYPYAYTYRDWVIHALNNDLPYDQFLQLQIAADRLVNDDKKSDLAALGFLTVGRRFLNNEHDIIDDRLDVVGRGTMGLTITCARCHDHKYDPIPTTDYYALYGVFASSKEPKEKPVVGRAHDPDATAAYYEELSRREQDVEKYKRAAFDETLKEMRGAELLAKYLLLAFEHCEHDKKIIADQAEKRTLEGPIAERWQAYLSDKKPEDFIFGPLRFLVGKTDEVFAAAAAQINLDQVHPLIADKLRQEKPTTAATFTQCYAQVIAQYDNEQPHSDPLHESLRQVIRGDSSPLMVPYEKFSDVISRKHENKIRELEQKVDVLPKEHAGAPPRAMVLNDKEKPYDVRVFIRGQPGNLGEIAPRAFVKFLDHSASNRFTNGSGRLELAHAITHQDNPLTARVMVNRVWAWHFGRGLVTTPSDFGLRTEKPLHAALLDHLAGRFIADGWSLKKLHTYIMSSATYQQSTQTSAETLLTDPENSRWSRFPRKRLELEALRDSALFVSGQLQEIIGGRPVPFTEQDSTSRRTLYLEIDRQNLPGMFRAFDFASPDAHTPMRFQTTVPQQALFLLNNSFIIHQARALAKRSQEITHPPTRIIALYKTVFARSAQPDEIKRAEDFLHHLSTLPAELPEQNKPHEPLTAWERLAMTLLLSNEFAFTD